MKSSPSSLAYVKTNLGTFRAIGTYLTGQKINSPIFFHPQRGCHISPNSQLGLRAVYCRLKRLRFGDHFDVGCAVVYHNCFCYFPLQRLLESLKYFQVEHLWAAHITFAFRMEYFQMFNKCIILLLPQD